jgi:hypothetical protein
VHGEDGAPRSANVDLLVGVERADPTPDALGVAEGYRFLFDAYRKARVVSVAVRNPQEHWLAPQSTFETKARTLPLRALGAPDVNPDVH